MLNLDKAIFQQGCIYLVPQIRNQLTGGPDDCFQVFSGFDGGNKGFHESGNTGGQFISRLIRLASDTGGNPVNFFNVL